MRYASVPVDQIPLWAGLNGVNLHGVTISTNIIDEDGNDKGGGLIANADYGPGEVLLSVPADLVLSKEQVEQHAKMDKQLRDVLEAVGPTFSQVGIKNSRRSIMIFLLMQLTHSSPDFSGERIGVTSPLSDYVNFLPKDILLPTFYTEAERKLLTGTSLDDALDQKLRSLDQELDHLRASTENIEWCQRLWWGGTGEEEHLTIRDWKTCDTIYRSRGLELPNYGDAMVPALDMANHSSDRWNARYDVDTRGNVTLVVRDETSVRQGEEITIMYGFGGACEMIFSYGFLEDVVDNARELFLSLSMRDDDPLAMAKVRFAKEAPGVRIYTDDTGKVQWSSPFAWWVCVNEEDGLDFQVVQDNEGGRELKAIWKNSGFAPSDDLGEKLLEDPKKDIFLLRATVLIQQRVELQGSRLLDSQDAFDSATTNDTHGNRLQVVDSIRRLRELETRLLIASFEALEAQKVQFLGSETVRGYLSQQDPAHQSEDESEDFS